MSPKSLQIFNENGFFISPPAPIDQAGPFKGCISPHALISVDGINGINVNPTNITRISFYKGIVAFCGNKISEA